MEDKKRRTFSITEENSAILLELCARYYRSEGKRLSESEMLGKCIRDTYKHELRLRSRYEGDGY